MGWGPGMAMQAMTSAVVPTWGVAGTTSVAVAVLAGLKASSLLLLVLLASLLLAQHSVVVIASTHVALLTFCWTFTIGMGVPTLHAARF